MLKRHKLLRPQKGFSLMLQEMRRRRARLPNNVNERSAGQNSRVADDFSPIRMENFRFLGRNFENRLLTAINGHKGGIELCVPLQLLFQQGRP